MYSQKPVLSLVSSEKIVIPSIERAIVQMRELSQFINATPIHTIEECCSVSCQSAT